VISFEAMTALVRDAPYLACRIAPITYVAERESLTRCRSIIREASLSLRGWDFPHVDERLIQALAHHIQSAIDFGMHREVWRLYQSLQFVHASNLWEAVYEPFRQQFEQVANSGPRRMVPEERWETVTGYVSVYGTMYAITEMALFARNLTRIAGLQEPVVLTISLHNVQGRILIAGPDVPWYSFYQTTAPDITYAVELGVQQLLEPVNVALAAIAHFFERFNWERFQPEAFRGKLDAFAGGNLAS